MFFYVKYAILLLLFLDERNQKDTMKRLCDEKEKELLLKNNNELLKGIYKTSAKGKFSDVFIGIFVSAIVMFAGIFFCVQLPSEFAMTAFYIWVAFSFTVPNMILRKIISKSRAKKESRRFLKRDNLMINGANIVHMDFEKGIFSYMEDDLFDEEGNPVIIDYPEIPAGFGAGAIGKRLIVMYDGESSFQLMKVNEMLIGLIGHHSEHYPLKKPLSEYRHVPHPNALNMDFCEHELTEEEKQKYAKEYVAFMQKGIGKGLTIFIIIYFVLNMLISVLYGISENCLGKAVPAGLALFVGFAAFVLLMRMLGKLGMKRTARFTHVKEVIFHSNVIDQRGKYVSAQLIVYEWNGDSFELTAYPNASVKGNTPYGNVLIKFLNKKGTAIFMPKEN